MKVSIVTPSFEQGRFIERTLQSVALQTGAEIEHVVFDGGSRDETVDILKSWTGRIKWWSEPDRGQTHAVNKGIDATDGEIIGWLNSDDIYYPSAVARVVEFFAANPDVDDVYGLADHIDEDDRSFEDYPTEDWDFERLKSTCFICQPAAFFRRSVPARYGMLDEDLRYCMDYEFWLRLGKAGARFAHIEQKLAGSRLYATNKTLGSRVAVHSEINDVMKRLFGRVPDRWIWNYAAAVTEAEFSRENDKMRYGIHLLAAAVKAAIRWNGAGGFSVIPAYLAQRLRGRKCR